ncbi:MAG TPA: VanW family protein [Acidimicrobiia bacterium]|nr:VanW family protein [Acidimicrobiia bacterium]
MSSTSRRWKLAASIAGGFVVLFAAALVVAYLVDTGNDERTLRGLVLADHQAGHMTAAELSRVISRIDAEVAAIPVRINLPDRTATFSGADLGMAVDRDATTEAALAVGKAGNSWDRFVAWLASFTSVRRVDPVLTFDRERAAETIRAIDGLVVEEPVPPRLVLAEDATLTVQEGIDGVVVDADAVVERLGHQVAASGPFDVDAPLRALPPSLDDEAVAAVADELNRLTADGIEVRVADQIRRLEARGLRMRLDLNDAEGVPEPAFDLESLQVYLESAFRGVELGGKDPVFDVVDDEPVLVEEGSPPLECCREDASQVVADAVLGGRPGPITVEARPVEDPKLVAWAKGEGVVEKVAEFTTEHACCEARVQNIQRFADLVRGVYLTPGETLSLNEHVGERTREKGFVPAGTIIRGHLVPTVGGGVSQFATTLFNAAFFAGFDFVTYQSHSLYISRYPYGREATISWPAPDLEIQNTTDYPALIWTSYTDTSITVSIYSTKSVDVEQVRQETSSVRACTRVDTYRLRTYEDGREVEDSVFATYRPSEGFDCNGNPTDRPDL